MNKLTLFALLTLFVTSANADWSEVIGSRKLRNKTFVDSVNPNKKSISASLGRLHYDNAGTMTNIDMVPEHVTAGGNDLYRVTSNGWHFALGHPSDKANDGWIGFGGRQGERWLKWRLVRAGYMRWSDKEWTDIGGPPTYNRANLSHDSGTPMTLPDGSTVRPSLQAVWENIWTTPGDGHVNFELAPNGDGIKERVVMNQAARDYAASQYPGGAPTTIYFGFVYQLDLSDVPRVYLDAVRQTIDTETDFNNDGSKVISFKNNLDDVLGVLPVGYCWVVNDDEITDKTALRVRVYYDDGNYYLLTGVRSDILNGFGDGDLVFDPSISEDTAASADDSAELNTNADITIARPNVDGTNDYGGYQFHNITMSGTIDVSSMTFYVWHQNLDEVYVDFYAEDTLTPAAFISEVSNLSNRTTVTSATVEWSSADLGGVGSYTSPDLKSIIQELVDSYTYDGDDTISIIINGKDPTSARDFAHDHWDQSGNDPHIYIEYTTGAAEAEDFHRRRVIITK